MSNNRFEIIYESSTVTHIETCPIITIGTRLMYDQVKKDNVVQLKFKNIVDYKITSVTVKVIGCLSDGTSNCNTVKYVFDNLTISRNETFGEQCPIYINNCDAKQVLVSIEEVCYVTDNNTVYWNNEKNFKKYTIKSFMLMDTFSPDLVEQYQNETLCSKKDIYFLQDYKDIWVCSCGGINSQAEQKCHTCSKSKKWIQNTLNSGYLTSKLKKKEKREKEQAEYEENKRQKQSKLCSRIVACVLIVCLFVWGGSSIYKNYKKDQAKKELVTSFEKGLVSFCDNKINQDSLNKIADVSYVEKMDREYGDYDTPTKQYKLGTVKGTLEFHITNYDGYEVESVEWVPDKKYTSEQLKLMKKVFFKTAKNMSSRSQAHGDLGESYDYYYFYSYYYEGKTCPLVKKNSEYQGLQFYEKYSNDNKLSRIAILWCRY